MRSCAVAAALAIALCACLAEKKKVRPDKALTYGSFISSGVVFAGIPNLEFPYSGLPDNYTLDCVRLHKILTEEFNISHITQPLQIRKLIGHSQYQQMMVSAARNSMPHWTFLDEITRHYPHHGFMLLLQPTPISQFHNHLVVEEDTGRSLQTISEARGGIRFIVVNMRGLKKLSMDVSLRKSIFNATTLSGATHRGVREALLQPKLEVRPQWYPPWPKDDDLYRSVVREFIELLNKKKRSR